MFLTDFFNKKNESTFNYTDKIDFNSFKLELMIGNWLGILDANQTTSEYDIDINPIADPERIIKVMKKNNITREDLGQIAETFKNLLTATGISKEEYCYLSNYNNNDLSFKCYQESGHKLNMSLKYEEPLIEKSKLIIQDGNEKKVYVFLPAFGEYPNQLCLYSKCLTTKNNINCSIDYLTPNIVAFALYNKQYYLSIAIKGKNNDEFNELRNNIFQLKKEDEIRQYLLSLSFPTNIFNVYKKLHNFYLNPITDYQKIEIKVTKHINKGNTKTTDWLKIEDGLITQAIITKNETTISIDKDGNWSYNTPKLQVKEENGIIDYNVKFFKNEYITSQPIPDILKRIRSEKDKVLTLTKSLSNKKRN